MERNKLYEFKGESLSAANWARRLGMKHSTLSNRLAVGWTVERALTEPPDMALSAGRKTITKNEAELMLNDLEYAQLPKAVKKCISMETKTRFGDTVKVKYGQLFRRYHPKEFQKWFVKTYQK